MQTDLKRTASASEARIPREIRPLFGRLPILLTESKEAYLLLLERFAAELAPVDVVEWISVKTITHLTWELLRYERSKGIRHNK